MSIESLVATALSLGLRLQDFCALSPDEFDVVVSRVSEFETFKERQQWEQMRLLASINIAPHIKKPIPPEKLVRFPWDNEKKAAEVPQMSRDEQMALMETLSSENGLKTSK